MSAPKMGRIGTIERPELVEVVKALVEGYVGIERGLDSLERLEEVVDIVRPGGERFTYL